MCFIKDLIMCASYYLEIICQNELAAFLVLRHNSRGMLQMKVRLNISHWVDGQGVTHPKMLCCLAVNSAVSISMERAGGRITLPHARG